MAMATAGPIERSASRLFVWRGIAAILFAFLAVVLPKMTALFLVMLFGAYALVDGIAAFAEGIRLQQLNARSWPSFVEGVLGVALAAFAWARPTGFLLVAVLAIGVRSLVVGVLELWTSISRRHQLEHPVVLAIAGVLSLAFGVALVVNPSMGALALLWVCAAYAFAFGVSFVALGVSVRHAARPTRTTVAVLLAIGFGGIGVAASAPAWAQDLQGEPTPDDYAPAPARPKSSSKSDERIVPAPTTSEFNSSEERDRRRRDQAEDELIRFRYPVAGHEFSPEQPSTTAQPGMPAPSP